MIDKALLTFSSTGFRYHPYYYSIIIIPTYIFQALDTLSTLCRIILCSCWHYWTPNIWWAAIPVVPFACLGTMQPFACYCLGTMQPSLIYLGTLQPILCYLSTGTMPPVNHSLFGYYAKPFIFYLCIKYCIFFRPPFWGLADGEPLAGWSPSGVSHLLPLWPFAPRALAVLLFNCQLLPQIHYSYTYLY